MTGIETAVRSINGGVFAKVSYETKNDTLKTSKVDGTINPFWADKDKIVKVVEDCQINLGVVYENAVNGRLEKKDIEPTFEAGENWMVAHNEPHKNLCQNKDHSKTYIRYMPMGNKTMTVKYILNGQDITDAIRNYKKPHVETATQANAGLTGADQIVWRCLEVANITSINILGAEITQ